MLSGKLNPQYVPYIDMGDHVIVINAEKVRLTGLKAQSKLYRRYTGFPGGLREEEFTRLLTRKPEKILEEAIKGMLPKTQARPPDGTKLKVYRGDKHPHQAQQPVAMEDRVALSCQPSAFSWLLVPTRGRNESELGNY